MPAPILVVDDDPDIQTTLRMVLEDEGYAVVVAATGAEALALLETTTPALVLLDLNMPVLSGWDFYAALERQHTRVPVVIMTAGNVALAEATQLQADGVLPKPFELDFLLRTVARFAVPTVRYERLTGLASQVYYVYDGPRYLGVVSEAADGLWQAVDTAQQELGMLFHSYQEAGRLLVGRAQSSRSEDR